ncbi:hypothetical protein [Lichenifustis flavocetrariae]|uniref:Uncharacterized protein n=1 Tax=Lichenifustis flavocetrariae TaxID=2949735 RepID=A0AA41YR24_9HYPH|nr:hypothetical protein [Lichenifustis flavocetrariae]MCW6506981.1 hypothetical protein [Lichenifustis flavocetrariae]
MKFDTLRFALVRLRRWMQSRKHSGAAAHGRGISRRAALALTAGAVFGPQPADAGMGVWIRTKKPGAAPLTSTIPAHYNYPQYPTSNGDGFFHAQFPAFSTGPNGTPLLLDTSLINQGGTGTLTDSLTDAGVGVGDSSGFAGVLSTANGVTIAELMLTDHHRFRVRTSGAARIMNWVQTLGNQTLVQQIMLTLDATLARVWDQSLASRVSQNSTTLAYHSLTLTQANFPIVSGVYVRPGGWAGLTHFVGVPDARRIAGLKKVVTGTPGEGTAQAPGTQQIIPELAAYFQVYAQGYGNPNTQGKGNGVDTFTTLHTLQSPPAGFTFDGYDFGDVITELNHNGFKFTNTYFGSRQLGLYANFPGVNFTILNVRTGDDGDTDMSHLYADNLDALLALHASTAVNGFGIYGRLIIPSAPSTYADQSWNPFMSTTQTNLNVTLLDILTNSQGHKYIKLNVTVPTNNITGGLPPGLNCNLSYGLTTDSRNPNGIGTFGNMDRGLHVIGIAPGVSAGFVSCTLDGLVPGAKYGQSGLNALTVAATGGFGPDDDGTGHFLGMQSCAVVDSPQDNLDINQGIIDDTAIISGTLADGSHVDNIQVLQIGAPNQTYFNQRPSLKMRNGCVVANLPRYATAGDLIDPIINGQSTNPYLAILQATQMRVGGEDADIYFELGKQSGGQANYGDCTATDCLLQGGTYAILISTLIATSAKFTRSNPMSVFLDTPNATGYAPGGTGANGIGGQIAFMPGSLPPAITPHKLYTVAGFSYAFVFSIPTNTTHDLAVGDILIVTGGTLVAGGLGAATFAVASVDGTGKALTLNVVNPGQYTTAARAGAPTFSMAIQSAASSSAGGTLTASQTWVYNALVLKDPATGSFVDTSASSTGTGYVAGAFFKAISTGLISANNNFVTDVPATLASKLTSVSLDANNKPYPQMNNVSAYNNRWLYAAPATEPTSDPATGVSGYPLVTTQVLSTRAPSINPPPTPITSLVAAAASATQMRLTFVPDGNARLSPDGALNPSGYQYVLRQTGGAWPIDGSGNIVWSNLPAVSSSGSNVTAVLPDVLTSNQSYDVMVRGVNAYDSPNQIPMQFAANSNVPSVIMPAA